MTSPGRLMAAEIAEQPAVWRRLLTEGAEPLAAAAARIADAAPRFVLFVARPKLDNVLYVAVSQSGGSPDLVRSVEVARQQGALTLAVTNNPSSELAAAAVEIHVDVLAGAERSVVATKSYTAELLALYLLFGLRDGRDAMHLPGLGERVVSRDVDGIAGRYRFAQRLIVTGRGYSYPTACEAALKLMETCYISAQAFSGADLLHGPLATVDAQVPVLAVVSEGRSGHAMLPVLSRLAERGADVLVVGAGPAPPAPAGRIALPAGIPDELSPLLEILPLQQLSLRLAIARGEDPDNPRGLHKMTQTL